MTTNQRGVGESASQPNTTPPRVAGAANESIGRLRAGIEVLSVLSKRAGAMAILDQLVVSATNFLTGVVIGRACTQDEFGLYMLGLSLVLIILSLQQSLITLPFVVYSPRLKGAAYAQYSGNTLVLHFGMSLFSVAALVFGGLALSIASKNQELASLVWTLAFVISFILLREFARRICFAKMRFETAIYLDVSVSVVQVSGLLLLANLGLISARLAFWVIGIACGVAGVVWVINFYRNIYVRFHSVFFDFRRNLLFGKWIFLSTLLWAFGTNAYPWLLAAFHGTGMAGIWAACFGVVGIANPVLQAVENYVGPRISHSIAENGVVGSRRLMIRISVFFSLLLAPFCILFILGGDALATLIYGEEYSGNGLIISVLGVNLLVLNIGIIVSRALFVLERSDLDFAVNCLVFLIMLLIGIPLVKNMGVVGAGFGLLIGNIAAAGTRWAVFSRLNQNDLLGRVP